jgi:NAD(P)-dependent dehydrogenase (short-subunit alcohol dehydrogenase family)
MGPEDTGEARPVAGYALVTGAASGIGRAIALALASGGYRVAAADMDEAGLAGTVAAAGPGARIVTLPLDLRSETGIGSAIDAAARLIGDVDLLVNNAGVSLPKPAIDTGWAEWDAVMSVNLKGAFFMSRQFAAYRMGQDGKGAIVNLGSTHGIVGVAGRSVYGISKAGIMHMTRMLAVEWADRGIRVNAVAPGTVMTPSRERMLGDAHSRSRMLARIPLGRFPTASEVAQAVLYLASPASASVTGHILVLDGGTTVC